MKEKGWGKALHYSWYWFGEGRIVYTTEESTGEARRWIQSCDNMTKWWDLHQTHAGANSTWPGTPAPNGERHVADERSGRGGARACSSFCAEVYEIAPFPWNPLLRRKICFIKKYNFLRKLLTLQKCIISRCMTVLLFIPGVYIRI